MTQRDLFWRAAGGGFIAAGYGVSRAAESAGGAAAIFGLFGIMVAAAGLLLLLAGKRVPMALRIERSRHRELPMAIKARRQAGRKHR